MIPNSIDSRLVGYARVSTQDQDLALQIDALRKHGVTRELIFTDKASGATPERPGLDACFAQSFETATSCSYGGSIDSEDQFVTSLQ